jgi:protein-S-isoprenylcysteine O-methyltransferase Ste14
MFYAIKVKVAIFLIAGIVFGVILMSWGFDDIAGLLTHPARVILLSLLLILFLIFGLFLPLGWMLSRLPKYPPEYNNRLVAFIGSMGILLFLTISPFSDRNEWLLLGGGNIGNVLRYLGVILFAIGAFFVLWASFHMCKTLRKQKTFQLIIDGPFKYVRHPRDFGGILIFVSIPLVFLSSLGLLLAILSAAGLFERIGREEKMLEQLFQDEWRTYAENTRCLIPWI